MDRASVSIKNTYNCLNDDPEFVGEDLGICHFLSKGSCCLAKSSMYQIGPTRAQFANALKNIPDTCPLVTDREEYPDDPLLDFLEPRDLEADLQDIFIPASLNY